MQDDLDRAVAKAESHMSLPGLKNGADRSRFLDRLRESTRAIDMLTRGDVDLAPAVTAPEKILPIKQAYRLRRRDPEEAIWLAFLSTQVGWDRPASCEQLYGAFGSEPVWQWARVRSDPQEFVQWLGSNYLKLRKVAPFGNHRKRETHKPGRGTPDTVRTYLELIGGSQVEFLRNRAAGDDPFDALYWALDPVARFGRTARYDFVRLLSNLGILESLGIGLVRPRHCYLAGATGPLEGAKRMFGAGDPPKRQKSFWIDHLEQQCVRLSELVACDLQAIEDALCNWQKKGQS